MGSSCPCSEYRRRRINIKNKTPEEIQNLMENHQNNIDSLEKKIKILKEEKEKIEERIKLLKNKLNPDNIEFKFKILNGRIYSIIIDKKENLKTVLTAFLIKVEDKNYSDINKIKILYYANDKTDLFREGMPINSFNFNSNYPFMVIPLNNN